MFDIDIKMIYHVYKVINIKRSLQLMNTLLSDKAYSLIKKKINSCEGEYLIVRRLSLEQGMVLCLPSNT